MTIDIRAGISVLGLTAGLAGCDGGSIRPPTAPSAIQQSPSGPSGPGGFPPGVLTDATISGVVFELTATGRTAIEGVAVYCELCGQATHSWAVTDANGFYTFSSGVWIAGTLPTSLGVEKAGYVDPPGLPAVTPPNPAGSGWREVMVVGHTRFDMELVRR
jgi:hypothetical protein